MISTQDLSLLPAVAPLRRLCQSLAMLEVILSPEWESRCYSFDAHWQAGESLASMRDGSGDEYFLLFSSAGAILKGFAHESEMSPYASDPPRIWRGVLDEVPEVFAPFLAEPAFTISDTTFCIWRTRSDASWRRGRIEFPRAVDPDGSAELLSILDGKPETYQRWAQTYYDCPVNLFAVTHIYNHHTLSNRIIRMLNGSLSREDVEQDQQEIGYPLGSST